MFCGQAFGKQTSVGGEVVFNTGMVGYPETMTDPSYRGQILVLTYPLIGNYGVPGPQRDEYGLPLHFESDRIQVRGLVVSERSAHYSHHSAVMGLDQWMAEHSVPGVFGVDTRALTQRIRDRGTLLGRIEPVGSGGGGVADDEPFHDPNVTDLVSEVSGSAISTLEPKPSPGRDPSVRPPTVVVVDCGCKANIIRSLLVRGVRVVRVPHDHYFLDIQYDGLLLSNGPGDPKMCRTTITNIERALAVGKPILGICLGSQLLALAAGADTYKLKFGHRSQNQPCVEQIDGKPSPRCVITSQNHGYAVRAEGLPEDWRVWFTNANDGTVEGIRHVSRPFMAVQFHPEATPGPVDTSEVFDAFTNLVKRRASF